MPCINCDDFGICQNRCSTQQVEVCDRCESPISFNDVSTDYDAVCLHHDEDLNKVEVRGVIVKNVFYSQTSQP